MGMIRTLGSLLDQYTSVDYLEFKKAMEICLQEVGSCSELARKTGVPVDILEKIYSGEYSTENPPPHEVYGALFSFFAKHFNKRKIALPTANSKGFFVEKVCIKYPAGVPTETIKAIRMKTIKFMQ